MNEKVTKWPEMPWDEVVDRVAPAVCRIVVGESQGTCFFISLAKDNYQFITGFVTAWHVLQEIKIGSKEDIYIVSEDKKVIADSKKDRIGFYRLETFDSAIIVVGSDRELYSKKDLLPIFPIDYVLARGADIGWLGYPGLADPDLCFFKGAVSGFRGSPPAYYVDGVAINGVSGGPVFDNRAHIIGLVSSYIPNRLSEHTTLPGLLCVVPINAVRYFFEHNLRCKVL